MKQKVGGGSKRLINNFATADWKHIDAIADEGAVVGCDAAGEVVEIGSRVETKVSVGDHVYGFLNGSNVSNHEDGAFAEYAVIRDGIFAKVPSGVTDEAASTLALGLVTCGQGLYQSLELPWPDAPATTPFPVLVYGGSTATGMLAVQLAKLSGLTVITTASKRNFQLLKDLGADEVFDYNDPECSSRIREYTKDKLYYAFDCIAEGSSIEICSEALSSSAPPTGLHYSALLFVKSFPRGDVKTRTTLAYTGIGEAFEKRGKTTPAMPDHYQFAKRFMKVAGDLLAAGKLKPGNFAVKEGGLEGILDGLKDLKENKVSGTKLVYRIDSV